MVYFVLAKESRKVKIGTAYDVKHRMSGMQTDNHEKLELLFFTEGDFRLENYFHQLFHKHRIRGEWFHLNEEIIAFIENPKIPSLLEIIEFNKAFKKSAN